ncbi:MAG: winged helix-turn-helix transcriptional regulator [Planctomycetes bacterium]|nr:winged helix-turn-helix transcriptional regulator [Planctomycetota bacterium]
MNKEVNTVPQRSQASVFKALGHPARLAMVRAVEQDERCVCELTELVGLDISTISRHLSVLKTAGVLADTKRGNKIFYRLCLPCVATMMRCLESPDNGTTCCEVKGGK